MGATKLLLVLLSVVVPALAVNMDAYSTLYPKDIDEHGEPMCCEEDMQCMNGHCNYDDLVKVRIPAPIVVWHMSCAQDGMLSGWCESMEDPPTVPVVEPSLPGSTGAPRPAPTTPAIAATGDPHFKTWSGEWYDFHGECDLVLMNAPSFHDGLGLQVQIRTKIRHGYSYIESAAIKIGGDVLVVSSFGEYAFNSVDSAVLPAAMGGLPLSYVQQDERNSLFRVATKDTEALVIKTFKDMVSVNLNGTHAEDFGDSVGILGSFASGVKLARDGSTVLQDPNAFAMEWQVRPEEDGILFDEARQPQYPVQCKMPENKQESRRLRGGISEEDAEVACDHIAEVGEKARCVFDVLATQDLEVAAGVF